MSDITLVLDAINGGDNQAAEKLLPAGLPRASESGDSPDVSGIRRAHAPTHRLGA